MRGSGAICDREASSSDLDSAIFSTFTVSFLVGRYTSLRMCLICYIVFSRFMFDAFYVSFKLKAPILE
jgi:hypothetical protein